MDRQALEQHLSEVNADLAVGIRYIERQRQIVFLLKEADPRAADAKRLLQEAEENHAILAAEADRLAKELEALPYAPAHA